MIARIKNFFKSLSELLLVFIVVAAVSWYRCREACPSLCALTSRLLSSSSQPQSPQPAPQLQSQQPTRGPRAPVRDLLFHTPLFLSGPAFAAPDSDPYPLIHLCIELPSGLRESWRYQMLWQAASLWAETGLFELRAIDPAQPSPASPCDLTLLLASYPSHIQRDLGWTSVWGHYRLDTRCVVSTGPPEIISSEGSGLGIWVHLVGHCFGLGDSLRPASPMYLEGSTFNGTVDQATASEAYRLALLVKRHPWIYGSEQQTSAPDSRSGP